MTNTVVGIVIREAELGENDRLLTILTAETGKLTVAAKGAKSLKSKNAGAAKLFCYSEFVLYSKNNYYWLRESSLIENFIELRGDLERYALALYFADVCGDVCVENNDESQMLALLLNSLYVLTLNQKPHYLIKAAFELRCAAISGFAPDLNQCSVCGEDKGDGWVLDIMNGCCTCSECAASAGNASDELGRTTPAAFIDRTVRNAIIYVTECSAKRIFAFALEPRYRAQFVSAAEKYLINHLERSFTTLNFYNELAPLPAEE